MKNPRTPALWKAAMTTAAFLLLSACSLAQEGAPATASQPADGSLRELDSQVRELRAVIEQMRTENAQSRAEMQELRQELQDTRKLLAPLAAAAQCSLRATSVPAESSAAASRNSSETVRNARISRTDDLGSRVQKLEESTQLLGSKIDEQYQTKVETAAKYRARLSGIVLMNAFHNVGASDNLDLPDYAQPLAPGSPQSEFRRHLAANAKLAWKFLDRLWPARRVRPMCNSILPEAFPQLPTA